MIYLRAMITFIVFMIESHSGFSNASKSENSIEVHRNLRGIVATNPPSSVSTSPPSLAPINDPIVLSSSWVDTWEVAPSTTTVMDSGIVQVRNHIGSSVLPGNVGVELYDIDCKNVKATSGLEVSLESYEYNSTTFTYDILVNMDKLASSPGGFLTLANENGSKGNVRFCTKVYTTYRGYKIASLKTNFNFPFGSKNVQFTLSSSDVQQDFVPEFAFNGGSATKDVTVCQCNDDFLCYSGGEIPISLNEDLVLCLEPSDPNVTITNLDIELFAGTVTYNPVVFGEDTWKEDSLTKVSVLGTKIKVATPVIAEFFIEGHTKIMALGTVEHVASEEGSPKLSDFNMRVSLQNDIDNLEPLFSFLRWFIDLIKPFLMEFITNYS